MLIKFLVSLEVDTLECIEELDLALNGGCDINDGEFSSAIDGGLDGGFDGSFCFSSFHNSFYIFISRFIWS